MAKTKPANRNPWAWVPSLYYAEGIPYILVMIVSVIMYKRLGISNTEIALYTSWLYLPWTIKPLWSPIVDLLKTKRFWIIIMQLLVGGGLAGVAFTLPMDNFLQYTLAFFWLLAFSSATHDIAADGFYMLGLTKHQQTWFVGIRSTFYRLSMITGQGLIVILAGYIESSSGLESVDFQLNAATGTETVRFVEPENVVFPDTSTGLSILFSESEGKVAMQTIAPTTADSIKNAVIRWNITHNFYEGTIPEEGSTESTDADAELSGIEHWIKDTFGKEVPPPPSKAGNLGLVYLKLSQEPDEPVTVNFSRESGDNSIQLVEGLRFVFTKENWNTPAMAVIQLDPKLDTESSAVFLATAGDIKLAWMVSFGFLSVLFFAFFIYHFIILPVPPSDKPVERDTSQSIFKGFFKTFVLFFKKDNIGVAIGFLLLFRFAEAQLVKLASPFLLDAQEVGGLGLTTGEVGFVYGTVGIIFLTIGGILGGIVAAKHGLKKWIWWMALAINLPDLVYVYLSYVMPDNFLLVNIAVAIEQFGYGFGFTAYMLYMIYISDGEHKTAHFAIATGFMALGMMLPGMVSGWLQELVGYQHFFIWVVIATVPSFLIIYFTKIDPEFGKKENDDDKQLEAADET